MVNKKRVAFIFGGQSTEHEVSRVSAQSVLENIDRGKYDILMIGITRQGKWLSYDGPVDRIGSSEWEKLAESGAKLITSSELLGNKILDRNAIDVVFPVLHGKNGEDGTIQGMLELADIPYVGCGVLSSALCMDKAYAKIVFEKMSILQAKYLVFTKKQIIQDAEPIIKRVEEYFTYPCFVKPSNAGSSIGVSKAHDRTELVKALSYAAEHDRRVLVEEFINGREMECAVLGNDEPIASTVGEVISGAEFYDYEGKYNNTASRTVIPADLSINTIQEIRNYALKAFKALDCSGLSRVDFFVHKETGVVYINEINTIPGFTSISMYPKLWEASGIPYPKLIDKLIELAIERHHEKGGKSLWAKT